MKLSIKLSLLMLMLSSAGFSQKSQSKILWYLCQGTSKSSIDFFVGENYTTEESAQADYAYYPADYNEGNYHVVLKANQAEREDLLDIVEISIYGLENCKKIFGDYILGKHSMSLTHEKFEKKMEKDPNATITTSGGHMGSRWLEFDYKYAGTMSGTMSIRLVWDGMKPFRLKKMRVAYRCESK